MPTVEVCLFGLVLYVLLEKRFNQLNHETYFDGLSDKEIKFAETLSGLRQIEWVHSRNCIRRIIKPIDIGPFNYINEKWGAVASPSGTAISISYSGEWTCVAVGVSNKFALGVDIEYSDILEPEVFLRAFNLSERKLVSKLNKFITPLHAFCLKEAVLKAISTRTRKRTYFSNIEFIEIHDKKLWLSFNYKDGPLYRLMMEYAIREIDGHVIALAGFYYN